MRVLLRCVLLLSVLVPAAAAPVTRASLVKEVEARAAADAAAGAPRATPSDLVLLYGKDAAAQRIEPRELVAIYENAYRRAAADRSLLDRLAPHGGWIFGAITLVLLIFRDALVGWLKAALARIRKFFYTRVAGTRVFRFLALSTYRGEVRDKFSRIILPFRPDKPLDMEEVYVPLRVKGSASGELLDVDDCLGRFRRMMVVGNPGAGKSMLLKNIVYRYSAGAAILGPRVPILLAPTSR